MRLGARHFPHAQRPKQLSFSTSTHQLSLGLEKGLLPWGIPLNSKPTLAMPLPSLLRLVVGPLLGSHTEGKQQPQSWQAGRQATRLRALQRGPDVGEAAFLAQHAT